METIGENSSYNEGEMQAALGTPKVDEVEPTLAEFLDSLAEVRAHLQREVVKTRTARLALSQSCSALADTTRRAKLLWKGDVEFHSRDTQPRMAEHEAVEMLSPRERQVLRLIAEGHSTRQIAGLLGVSFKTAVTHRTNLPKKLNAHESTALVRIAIRIGLVPA